ncbi:hypothetical protein [Sphingomonas sp.]|jgi:hypothetical protein|uniref:hypothetical protein n=1 Tax=Sphingomonas sp. TaxID=28214 RepID=UPI0026208026|nr:hypothetical protein [Sphingomonas sp.]MDF2493281.1 hypothetical protein [Sphingomonas sp.]
MIIEHELTAALDQVRANLSAIDLDACRRASADIERQRQHIDRTETDARARGDELRPVVNEIERVGAERYDERSGSSAFHALLRGELDKRPTGAELLREYRKLMTALGGASSAREALGSAERQGREDARAAIAAAMKPLDVLANEVAVRLVDEFRQSFALLRTAKALAQRRAPEHINEAASALRHQLGTVEAPPAITGALEEFGELFALANVAVPTVIGIQAPVPDYALINAAAGRISAADRAAERAEAERAAAARERAQ